MKSNSLLKLSLACATLSLASVPASAATLSWIQLTSGTNQSGTWDTTSVNWNNGTSNVAWTDGNAAVFVANNVVQSITVSGTRTATQMSLLNGVGTFQMNGGAIDVTGIDVAGGNFDMFSKLTGNHDVTFTVTSGTNQGRVTMKTSNDYTGATVIGNNFTILSDTANNVLPTATTLNLNGANALFRISANKSQQVGLLTGNGILRSQGGSTANVNTFTISTAAGVSGTFTGQLANSAATDTLNIVIGGSGTQTLAGTSSYRGTTTINAGTLILGSNLTASSAVTVSGGNLQSSVASVTLGAGTVSMSAGTLSARGTGTAGTFALAADQNFTTTGGTIALDLGTSFDKITGSGAGVFSLSNTTLALNLIAGFDYASTYAVLSGFSSGSLANLSITGYDTGAYTASLSNAGVLSFSAVPEPATLALIGLGAAGGLMLKRRRVIS